MQMICVLFGNISLGASKWGCFQVSVCATPTDSSSCISSLLQLWHQQQQPATARRRSKVKIFSVSLGGGRPTFCVFLDIKRGGDCCGFGQNGKFQTTFPFKLNCDLIAQCTIDEKIHPIRSLIVPQCYIHLRWRFSRIYLVFVLTL